MLDIMVISDELLWNIQSSYLFLFSATRVERLRSGDLLSLSDQNIWYYPMHGHDSDEEELPVALPQGNWGHKNAKGGRWVRRGKITAWGPEMEDWEVSYVVSLTFHDIEIKSGRRTSS